MITRAGIADIPRLNTLINSAYRGEYSKKGWTTEADILGGIRTDEADLQKILSDSHSVFLKYEEEGNLMGCVHLRNEGDQLYLGMLTVNPESQGKGIGKQLLLAAEEEARRLGCSAIYMTVISVRHELIAWYIRHGYEDTGIRKPFRGEGIPRMPLEFAVLRKRMEP